MNVTHQIPKAGALRLRPVAMALLSIAATQLAFAQAASTTTTTTTTTAAPAPKDDVYVMNQFTVQGSFAGSLEMAAQEKENSVAIVEVIAPEDIGKLPDISIADSLTRLTGLTSQRTNGRNQGIAIRGLNPDFSVGTLDGIEQVSTNDNRGIEFDQYPAELVSGVTVYKTGQADMVGGIAGTIDLKTTNPLSIDHRVIAVSAFYNWTQYKELTPGLKKADSENFTASYVDQFDDGKVGLVLGFSHTNTPFEGEQFQAWGYPTDSNGNFVLGGTKSYVRSSYLKRDAFIAVLENKPNDNIHSKLDIFHTNFTENQLLRGMEIPLAFWSSAQLQPGYTVTNGLATSETLKNVQPVVRNDTFLRKDNLSAFIWNLDVAQKSDWPVTFTSGYSTVKRNDENLETYSGLGFAGGATNPDTVTITTTAGQIPNIQSNTDYTNTSLFTLTDPQGWGTGTLPVTGMEGYLKYFQERDDLAAFKLITKHVLDASIFKDVEVGVSYTDRYKGAGQFPSGYLANANGQPHAPLPKIVGTTDLSYLGNLKIYAYDPNAAYNSGLYTFVPNPNPGDFLPDRFNVWEDITRPFVQFDLKGALGDIPFDGNIGVVADLAHQHATGYSGNGGATLYPVSGGASYADILPSLNLIFRPATHTDIRFSVSREEARPRMYDMRASRSYSYNATLASSNTLSPWSGTSGNPGIKPWIADSVDLSLEHYFAKGGGYVSIAVFEKKLLSYIYQQSTVTNYAGYPYTSPQAPVQNLGFSNTPVNGQGGTLSGVEGTLQITSDVLTNGGVKGFGLVAGGAITDSQIQPWGPGNGTAPLDGLSKKVASLTLYYESHGFAARISGTYRSATREYLTTFGAPNIRGYETNGDGFTISLPEKIIDAQVSYSFKSGALKGMSVYLQAYNLNDEPLVTYNNGDPRQLINYQKYGASYSSGISYRF